MSPENRINQANVLNINPEHQQDAPDLSEAKSGVVDYRMLNGVKPEIIAIFYKYTP